MKRGAHGPADDMGETEFFAVGGPNLFVSAGGEALGVSAVGISRGADYRVDCRVDFRVDCPRPTATRRMERPSH